MLTKIVLLLEEETPAYWSRGVADALTSAFPTSLELEARITAPQGRVGRRGTSLWLRLLTNALLRTDRQIRKLARWNEDNGRGPSTTSRALSRQDEQSPTAPLAVKRVGEGEAWVADHEVVISLLSDTPYLIETGSLSATSVIWAECDGVVMGSSPYGFLRALADRATTRSLEIRGARKSSHHRVLMRSRCAMRSVSPSLNDELLAARVGDLLAMSLWALQNEEPAEVLPDSTSRAVDAPQPAHDSRVLVRVLGRRVTTARVGRPRTLQWALAYRRTAGESVDESFTRVPESELLVPPPGHAWADPFPIRADGKDLIFFEQESLNDGRGHIAVAELRDDGTFGPVRRVLESTHHLSYPLVFRAHGEWFMVPESRAEHRVSLYRAVDFPFKWTRECDLLTGVRLADATLFQRDGRWWMLACRIGAGESTFEDLWGFSAPDLCGPWSPISRLPVSSDATSGRPAGHILETPNGLLRPAQDGSFRYGYGLRLQEVTTITANRFVEREYSWLGPTWAPELRGVHTFNRSARLTLVDVLRRCE